MVGGPLSGGFPAVIPFERGQDRRASTPLPADNAGTFAEARQKRQPQLPEPAQGRPDSPDTQDSYSFDRPVEMRARAARLEWDDSGSLPRYMQQALSTYQAVAGTREAPEVEVVGLDLQV
ncbi:hypothetical protein [Hydrocarboniclastica marina]|uniref:hypothetical protein n=1 Tax=Hydrocarboniclastica marina TaxID=2259620 RepID=UPI0010A8D8BD|nr:hypothetical protein [Hydrocarboniclastica marina]